MNTGNVWRPYSRRGELLVLVREFISAAAAVPGVLEIAIIGSLTTSKEDPKDADVLVTIQDNLDLTQLARVSRRLQGRAQSIGHGADVFLRSAAGEYLGRICHWKECRPGIRISCDADHCGRREFLHDDLATVTLRRNVIDAPPIRIWPRLELASATPADLVATVIDPLRVGLHEAPSAEASR